VKSESNVGDDNIKAADRPLQSHLKATQSPRPTSISNLNHGNQPRRYTPRFMNRRHKLQPEPEFEDVLEFELELGHEFEFESEVEVEVEVESGIDLPG